jgi:AraC-like DNA-binding protein
VQGEVGQAQPVDSNGSLQQFVGSLGVILAESAGTPGGFDSASFATSASMNSTEQVSAMIYLSYTPPAPLSQFVERFWLVSGGQSPRKERILPSGTVELVVNLREDRVTIDSTMQRPRVTSYAGVVASGTYSGAFDIDAMQHELMMGVHFRPGGARAAFDVPANELADSHVDLAAISGELAAQGLRDRLCEAVTHEARFQYLQRALSRQLPRESRIHPVVRFALERFGATGMGASVRDVARDAGLSHRRFLTIFTTEVGLSPKLFCRILRFRHLHALAQRSGRIDWAQLAQTCGFFDQSHLANEFRKLSGLTPTEYERDLQRSRDILAGHVAIS